VSFLSSRKARFGTLAASAAGLLLLAGCSASVPGTSASAGTLSVSTSAACTAGAKEGTVSYWSTTDPGDFQKEIAPFEKANPKIKVQYTSLQPTDATQRIITEVQAHHAVTVDALTMDLASGSPLFDQKLVRNVDYSKLGIPTNLTLTVSGVQVYRVFRDLIGIAYNPKITPASSLPATWADLISPKWAGKVIVDPRGVYLGGLATAWGQTKTLAWFNSFHTSDKPVVVQGATASLQQIISGQSLLSTSASASAVLEQQKAGAPVAITYLDAVSSQDKYAFLMKGAAHPNAAACFLSWWGGKEGQAQQLAIEYKANVDQPTAVPAGTKLGFVTKPSEQTVVNNTTAAISKILTQ
jgi:iron(III) transport system substrate-binding protein